MPEPKGLQETYAPESTCFGCGPANRLGLRIRSHAAGDLVVADWQPEPQHEAFPGVLNGGIILQTQGITTQTVLAVTGLILLYAAIGDQAAQYRLVRTGPGRA